MPAANIISGALQGLRHLFFPDLCEGCSKPLVAAEQVLCLSCLLQLSRTEYHTIGDNDTALRFAGRLPFQQATSFAYFTAEGLLQHLLHLLKYKDKKQVGIWLGRQFAIDLKATPWIKTIDAIVPVPLHLKKESQRGYNQSILIAEGMADVLSIPVNAKALARSRFTESQTKKTRAERAQNMQDAFIIKDATALMNKHLLLVDDVLTTGATLESCALALLKVPGVKISFATIGIAMD
jgi:ComF family protein